MGYDSDWSLSRDGRTLKANDYIKILEHVQRSVYALSSVLLCQSDRQTRYTTQERQGENGGDRWVGSVVHRKRGRARLFASVSKLENNTLCVAQVYATATNGIIISYY